MKTNVISVLERSPEEKQYDQNAKEILRDKALLATILKEVVPEVRLYSREEIIGFLSDPQVSIIPVNYTPKINDKTNENKILNEGEVTFDVLFDLIVPNTDKPIKVIVDVEAQKNSTPGYDLITRGFFYCARLISKQLNQDFTIPDYDSINKVYSIWICMNEKDNNADTITKYAIDRNDILGVYSGKERYDLLEVVMIRVGSKLKNQISLTQLLSIIFSDKLSNDEIAIRLRDDYGLVLSEEAKEARNIMCNLSLGIREDGAIDALCSAIKSLMENTKCSFEDAIRNLGISASEEEKIKAKIESAE